MMVSLRRTLPQLGGQLFLTDGGIETTLIFHEGLELPHFAAFRLLETERGRSTLRRYYQRYITIARRNGFGFVLESPTWRASKDWTDLLGYDEDALIEFNRSAIDLMAGLKADYAGRSFPVVVSGCIGPRGDGYTPERMMGVREAEDYHALQAEVFADAGADMVSAITMNYVEEAIGVARAAVMADIAVVISFTVETDGRLPSGQTLEEAINRVDDHTGSAPAYYMINCAHPTHFAYLMASRAPYVQRIRGLRANASKCSHAELDGAQELDEGNPAEFGAEHGVLLEAMPHLAVIGGCCGTDHRHVDAAATWLAAHRALPQAANG